MCEKYRGIALLDVAYKILAILIKERLQEIMEEKIGDYEAGFRKGKSIVDHIHTLRQIQETSKEQLSIHAVFIDCTRPYDSIMRSEIFSILDKYDLPKKLINLVKTTLSNTKFKVEVGSNRKLFS